MTLRSDGKQIVWAVFNNDGYECSSLVGVFESEESANAAASRIESLIELFYTRHMRGHEWRGSVKIRSLVLGEYRLPPDAQYVLDEPTNMPHLQPAVR
jgi:hypothetical protein